jgi:hypothetical protein
MIFFVSGSFDSSNLKVRVIELYLIKKYICSREKFIEIAVVRMKITSTSEHKPCQCFDRLNMTGLCQPELVEGLLVLYLQFNRTKG